MPPERLKIRPNKAPKAGRRFRMHLLYIEREEVRDVAIESKSERTTHE